MPPFFFSRWMTLIKSQPSKWKGKKKLKPGDPKYKAVFDKTEN